MKYIIYAFAGISMILAVGGLSAYSSSRQIGLLLSSLVSIACAIAAIFLVSFWPLAIGFAINLGLKFVGLDPGSKR